MGLSNIANQLFSIYFDTEKEVGDKKLLGIFLYGSQNYGLDTDNSDIDVVALVTPSYTDVVTNTQAKTYTIDRADGGRTTIVDIRDFLNRLVKGNPHDLEVLWSPNRVISPQWAYLVDELRKSYSTLAYCDKDKTLHTIYKLAENALKTDLKREHSPKLVSRVFFYAYSFYRYLNGNCEEMFSPDENVVKFIMSYKMGEHAAGEARSYAQLVIDCMQDTLKKIEEPYSLSGRPGPDGEVCMLIYKFQRAFCNAALAEYFNK